MIYTTINKVNRYFGISDTLDTALHFLQKVDTEQLCLGTNEVDGENVYANVFEYMTVDEKDAMWEGHIQYADIHMVLDGQEQIGVSDISTLREIGRDEENDFIGYEGKVENWFKLSKGKILIVFPEDAHIVKVKLEEEVFVKKLVIKVKI